jgi:hypothetical protein
MDTIVALLRWIVYGAEHDRVADSDTGLGTFLKEVAL